MESSSPTPHQDPSSPALSNANSQHYLAEIKYPNIPDIISIDKIFNVLQKIRTTSKPLFYKWQPLNKPKHGEIYLEQKYPVTRDSVTGDQFSIVDDGYLWSSVPRPEVRDHLGQQIEVFRWLEGYSPGDACFTMSKTEYRLKVANNVLFLIHYLDIKNPCVPVKTALPSTKISPIYLQQQFFQNLKQQLAQINSMRRSPSPVPGKPSYQALPTAIPKNAQLNKSSSFTGQQRSGPIVPPTVVKQTISPEAPSSENTLDIFDSFGDYEAAQYRYSIVKPVLYRLLESKTTTLFRPDQIPEGLETDIISAIKKKLSSINERIEEDNKTKNDLMNQNKRDSQSFWNLFNQIGRVRTENDLSELEKRFRIQNRNSMEIDSTDEVNYISL